MDCILLEWGEVWLEIFQKFLEKLTEYIAFFHGQITTVKQ